jgi:hypothetical protein
MSVKSKISTYFPLFLLALASCNNPQKQLEIQTENNLKSLSELGTVEYVVSKVVKADDNATWYKFGDRKILFSCKASLKAGIDLSKLSNDSIKINANQKSISLLLPKAELLSFNMKPDDVRLVYEKTEITRFSFSNAERDMIMTQGENSIKNSVEELGILTDAENNAKMFLEAFLSQAGYSKIIINFSKD